MTHHSSLAEAEETKSTEKSYTFTCTTEDEIEIVASKTRGTANTSRYSELDCSTTSKCTSTCPTWGIYSNTRLVERASWGMSSITCCTSKLKEFEAEYVEVRAAWGVSACASFCWLDATTLKALEEPIPFGLSRGLHHCFFLYE